MSISIYSVRFRCANGSGSDRIGSSYDKMNLDGTDESQFQCTNLPSSSGMDKKRNRIDSFAAVLASRSRTNAYEQDAPQTSSLQSSLSIFEDLRCSICSLNIHNNSEFRRCANCNKEVHLNCDNSTHSFEAYVCVSCKNNANTIEIDVSTKTLEESSGQITRMISGYREIDIAKSSTSLCLNQQYDCLTDQYSSVSTPQNPMHTPSSLPDSESPTPQPEETLSDNEEYQPPSSIKKTDSSRASRGKGKGKKPALAVVEKVRQGPGAMKTRSGGVPSTTSYAAKFNVAYTDTDERASTNAQKLRGKGSKGKGGFRGRRNAGRGGKLISMYTSALNGNGSRRESGQRESIEDEGKLSPDKNDYIRTAVVTNADDKFTVEYPNLCLICGSIGNGAEGTMISCMACAQSFHTYCVSIREKLNMTLIKRGWRCLDCTVCEGCGSGNDESNLLLCDECDISFHIYCCSPPLESIPKGSWRCKWCSACVRCNKQVAGSNLQSTEGYCDSCYSLRKCPKCSKFYEIGELMLKCQHCLRWFHGRCEGHLVEDEVENATENAFRCSFCRPQSFNDASNMPIVVDNVMVSKSMVEQIHGIRRFPFFSDQCFGLARSYSNEPEKADEIAMGDECATVPGLFSTRGRGGANRGGPGRRVLKLGVGGFAVRNPKNRSMMTIATQSMDDESHIAAGTEEEGRPKIRRPRKLRKPLLEDAYPANIQESFFGVPCVESRTLAEQQVDEPQLIEYKKANAIVDTVKVLSELTEHSAELLRNEQEMDMLDDIPLVDDIGLDMDIGNLDFTDLIVSGDDEEEAVADNVDSIEDEFNAGSTSSLMQSTAEICSPLSASSSRIPSQMNDNPSIRPGTVKKNDLAIQGRQANESTKSIEHPRLSSSAQATERWEEDEPLGDRATKAAVLYANVQHPDLKTKFPLWADRVRQIHKVWRELNSEKRQEFVEWARKNRVNCPIARKRGSRKALANCTQEEGGTLDGGNIGTKHLGSEFSTCSAPNEQAANKAYGLYKTEALANDNTGKEAKGETHFVTTISQEHAKIPTHQQQETQFQRRTLQLKLELQCEEEKSEKFKKMKRALAAKQRQILKRVEPRTSQEVGLLESDLKSVEDNLNATKKALQNQQRVIDNCKCRLKEHLGPKIAEQMLDKVVSRQTQPTTSTSLVPFKNTQIELDQQIMLSLLQPAKGARGRKRKKPLPEKARTPVLGGVSFSTLQTTLEKEVYDLVDGMLEIVEKNSEWNISDALFVKRILLSQQQKEQTSSSSILLQGVDTLKTKKKRQVQAKGRSQPGLNTEFELIQERVKESLSNVPPMAHSLEQYQANDKQMLAYPNQMGLPEHQGTELQLPYNQIGDLNLPFMPDFYEDLETRREDYIDEEFLFPPTMMEICAAVDLDALAESDDEADETTVQVEDCDGRASGEGHGLAFPFLSIDNIGDRAKLVKSALLLGSSRLEMEVPIDPHWSRFDEEPTNLSKEVEVIIEVDPSILTREELLDNLRQLLGGDCEMNAVEMETPPYTPNLSKLERAFEQEGVPEAMLNNNEESTTTTIICRKCGTSIHQVPIEDPYRIGLSNIEPNVAFCSIPCYFKFVALCKIPLAVGLLEIAESCVDEETIGKLRQISADHFARRINAGLNIPRPCSFEESPRNLAYSIPSSSSANINEMIFSSREFPLRSSELSTLMKNNDAGQERRKGGYKWYGHGWIKCDSELIQSFQRQQEEVKQKFAEINTKATIVRMSQDRDTRQCAFCAGIGDGDQELTGRLLNVDANEWVHVNCALWSAEVHVSEEGALMNVDEALRRARKVECKICGQFGASIRCYKLDCANKDFAFHLHCAKHSNGYFVKDKTFFCANHDVRPDALVSKFGALRRLFIQRDENQLLSKIFSHNYPTDMVMRVGSLIFHKIGQLLPEQLKAFTTSDFIFPVGYKSTRIFWSLTNQFDYERMRYECSVNDNSGSPEFSVRIAELDREFKGSSPTAAWSSIQQSISALREKTPLLRFFPAHLSGESLFGFAEPSISKILESLPGVDQLFTYTFKHGGTPLMELPLAENPSGCARCEPCFRTLVKKKHRPIISNSPKKADEKAFTSEAVVSREGRIRSASSRFTTSASPKIDQEMLRALKASGISEKMLQMPYMRNNEAAQLNAQYKDMKKEWRENVYLARSRIQGLGLYAKRDLDMNQMIIEYIGEMIRNEVCEMRQKKYTEQNRGEYMFRIDVDWVVDATMSGGLARYINHSCDPNCGTKILTVNDERKIVIYANRPIKAGEEFTYDYQFEIEEVNKKIPCLCGAPNCARWMN